MKNNSYSFSKGISFTNLKKDVSSTHSKSRYIGIDRRKNKVMTDKKGYSRGKIVHDLSPNRAIDIKEIKKSKKPVVKITFSADDIKDVD